ncbi:unnamed protein product [Psylliodes chrysocephalus]|uniref:Uncharacterized protein n=1 Tax=Psylliodes chrysocephalus TaxID=3402493 RepID=A0A9P0CXE7_9CUCU|nr:unnamed protein product [Psylliodes chrysocephala]
MFKKIFIYSVVFNIFQLTKSIRVEENDKDLPNNVSQEDYIDGRKRPQAGTSSGCNFKNKRIPVYKTDGSGRTFLDFAYVNVEYNINCGGGGGGTNYPSDNNYNANDVSQYHKPGFGGHHKPIFGGHHKPGFGGNHKPDAGFNPGFGQKPGHHGSGHTNRPFLSALFGNRPQHSDSQETNEPSVANNFATSSIFPSPQEFGQGLGDGISSFVQTIPQIAQSFQSLLPNFDNFQWPQFGSLFPGQNAPNTPLVENPSSIVPNDEIKPVHEEHDPITDPYKLRLRTGNNNYYSSYQNYRPRNKQEEYILGRTNVRRSDDANFQPRDYQKISTYLEEGIRHTENSNLRFPS